jgi:hypothetical protein
LLLSTKAVEMAERTTRSGKFVRQDGFEAFVPASLPPEPPVAADADW